MVKWLYGAILVLLVGACSGGETQDQILLTENAAKGTEIASLRQTATVEADRMLITLEHAQTEVQFVQRQGTDLAATLAATGFDLNSLSAITPLPNLPTSLPNNNAAPLATQDANAGNTIQVTPFTVTPNAPAAPQLTNIVLSQGVGSNDCALASTTQFSRSTVEIYVVATAINVQPGTTITSLWQSPLGEQRTFDFTPNFLIEEACIWFYIDQSDIAFSPGAWSVSLSMNGLPVGPATSFTVIEG